MPVSQPNLIDIDSLIEVFTQEHASGIATMHRIYYQTTDELSLRALKAELVDELRTGCVTFINKEFPIEELNSYLFYVVNDFCKKRSKPVIKKKTEYLCPGCLFLGKSNPIGLVNRLFKCDSCQAELKVTTDPKKVAFFRAFFHHSKSGYHCQECDRFIPHPLDDSPVVTCPYYDCCFVGGWGSLKRMHHPTALSNPEKLILDVTQEGGGTLKDTLVADESSALSQMEIEEELESQYEILTNVIDSQKNGVPYSSADSTAKHKMLAYQAFANLLKKYPEQMVDYLLNESRSGGFQHKVFQEYISLLEETIPFSFKKNKKLHKVESLLDDNLNLFDGISVFEGIVSEKLVIKNGTREFYIGGRESKVSKPYYIGKLLSIIDKKDSSVLMDHVKEYSFSLIKMKDIVPGTEVIVTHLRVPPHYQMKGMVYVNRIRKKIVERSRSIMNKKDESPF